MSLGAGDRVEIMQLVARADNCATRATSKGTPRCSQTTP
jgi:hypothetical protein